MRKFELGNERIIFDNNFDKLNCLRIQFNYLAEVGRQTFTKMLQETLVQVPKEQFLDKVVNVMPQLINEEIFAPVIANVAINFLVSEEIYDCDEEMFYRKYQKRYFDIENQEGYQLLKKSYNTILDEYNQLKEYRRLKRASRKHWVGGGFGVRSAMLGTIEAGAMNLATNAFRGMTDKIVDSSDIRNMKDQKQKLVEAEGIVKQITDSIFNCILGIYYACEDEYGEKKEVKCFWSYSNNLEKAKATFKIVKTRIENIEKKIELIKDIIMLAPYESEYYTYLYLIEGIDKNAVRELAGYLGYIDDIRRLDNQMLKKELDILQKKYMAKDGPIQMGLMQIEEIVQKFKQGQSIESTEDILNRYKDSLIKYTEDLLQAGRTHYLINEKNQINDMGMLSDQLKEDTFLQYEDIISPEEFLDGIITLEFSFVFVEYGVVQFQGTYTEKIHEFFLSEMENIKKRYNISDFNSCHCEDAAQFYEKLEKKEDFIESKNIKNQKKENRLDKMINEIISNKTMGSAEQISALKSIGINNFLLTEANEITKDCWNLKLALTLFCNMGCIEYNSQFKERVNKIISNPTIKILDLWIEYRKMLLKYHLIEGENSYKLKKDFKNAGLDKQCDFLDEKTEILSELCKLYSTNKCLIEKEENIYRQIVYSFVEQLDKKGFTVNFNNNDNFAKDLDLYKKIQVPEENKAYAFYEKNDVMKSGVIVCENGIYSYCGVRSFIRWREVHDCDYLCTSSKWVKFKYNGSSNDIPCKDDSPSIRILFDEISCKIISYEAKEASENFALEERETLLHKRLQIEFSNNKDDKLYIGNGSGRKDIHVLYWWCVESMEVAFYDTDPIVEMLYFSTSPKALVEQVESIHNPKNIELFEGFILTNKVLIVKGKINLYVWPLQNIKSISQQGHQLIFTNINEKNLRIRLGKNAMVDFSKRLSKILISDKTIKEGEIIPQTESKIGSLKLRENLNQQRIFNSVVKEDKKQPQKGKKELKIQQNKIKENEEILRKLQEKSDRCKVRGITYETIGEADKARDENAQIEQLKSKLITTKSQKKRRAILSKFCSEFHTTDASNRYQKIKNKVNQKEPKSILLCRILGISLIVAFIILCITEDMAGMEEVSSIVLLWVSIGLWIWLILKIVLIIKKLSPKHYLNIKHI